MQACLATHVHYFDITGEIEVFELAHSVHEKAQRSGIVLCPGVGFDVVPTDCVAARLKQAMPDATHLALGFDSNSGLSKGTAKTAIESAGGGSRVRRDGRIVEMPLASQHATHRFRRRRAACGRHSMGRCQHRVLHDRASPTSRCSRRLRRKALQRMRRANMLRPLLRQRWVRELVKFGIERRVTAARADAARQQSQLRLGRGAQCGRADENRAAAHGEWLLADGRHPRSASCLPVVAGTRRRASPRRACWLAPTSSAHCPAPRPYASIHDAYRCNTPRFGPHARIEPSRI